jgi:hypothetical protein
MKCAASAVVATEVTALCCASLKSTQAYQPVAQRHVCAHRSKLGKLLRSSSLQVLRFPVPAVAKTSLCLCWKALLSW